MNEVSIPSPHGDLRAFSATPRTPAPWAGVVVIHDAFGMTTALSRHVEWLASAGYVAAAPDLARGRGMMSCVRAAMRETAVRKGPMFDDIEATRVWLTKQPGCTDRIGVIGFCMGGGFALALAPGHGFSASSVNYGRIPPDAETYLSGACPIVGSFGGKDSSLKGSAQRLEKICEAQQIPHDIKEYPEVGHSFMDHHERRDLPLLFALLRGPFHATYHEPSATDAEKRIVAFFDTHLKSAPPHAT